MQISFITPIFTLLGTLIGGFEEDELRKILVRAGAVREYHNDGTEWWYLLSREQERIGNLQNS